MFCKIVRPDAWDYGAAIATLVKVGSRGLRGHDLSEFVKRAGHDILPYVDRLRPGETGVHLIAMGASERYGPNRNGDAFEAAMLKRDGPTFEKYARWYRNHANGNPAKSYGRVVKFAYNDPMARAELLVGLNRTKEAAERNGGLVETHAHDLMERGKDVGVSMSCKVPYDVCNNPECGNQAPSRAHYCDDRTVKLASGKVVAACSRGGVRRNMLMAHADGHVNFVDNPRGTFFDISDVEDTRPADRIAYTLGVVHKAAASARVVSGAELAESAGVHVPSAFLEDFGAAPHVARRVKLARAMLAAAPTGLPTGPARPAGDVPAGDAAHAYRALAAHGVVLPLEGWLQLASGCPAGDAKEAADTVATYLPTALAALASAPDLEGRLATGAYEPATLNPSKRLDEWAAKLAADHGVRDDQLARRAARAAVLPAAVTVKSASCATGDDAHARLLAEEYALYQLAALDAIEAAAPGQRLAPVWVAEQNRLGSN